MDAESPSRDLSELRLRIERVDRQILALLAERQRIVTEVAHAKLQNAAAFRDRTREDHLLRELRSTATSLGLDAHQVERMYRVVLDMSVAHQEATVRGREDAPLRVTYQGTEGSYSHLAAQRRYGGRPGGVLLEGHDSFAAAAAAVLAGAADLALLPIENTTAGSINETYDLLSDGRLVITGEEIRSIEHCLLGLPGATLEALRVVGSHPQALAQCRAFFAAHPHLQPHIEIDTAGAARSVRDLGDLARGAIASAAAATTYGLEILARGIQTEGGNATRFVEVSRHAAPLAEDRAAKTSLLLALADRPGALGEILLCFARRGLSLCKLESRPIPSSPWQYRFYIDLIGHAASAPFAAALEELRPLTTELHVLGSYAAARLPVAPGPGEAGAPSPQP